MKYQFIRYKLVVGSVMPASLCAYIITRFYELKRKLITDRI